MVWTIVCIVSLSHSVVEATEDCDDLTDLAIEAALGGERAQYNLAVEFWRGQCVSKNLENAAYLWEQAAEQGNNTAKNNLGYLLYYGEGIPKNQKKAIELWTSAALAGEIESKIHLAYAYFEGGYLEVNLDEAYAWAESGKRCAIKVDSKDHIEMADDILTKLHSKMSTTDQKRGEVLITERSNCAPN